MKSMKVTMTSKGHAYEINEGYYECKEDVFEVKERHLRRMLLLLRLLCRVVIVGLAVGWRV